MKRPRVRHVEDGEVELDSYRAASSQAGLFKEVFGLVAEGMSQRGLGRVKKDDISKSAISRMWEEKSREQLSLVRERDLKGADWLAVMIDGVFIGGENCVVIALGIEASGRKQVLDFEVGSSESRETVERLIGCLEGRGVHSGALLVVQDGSAAIKGAVSRVWPSAHQQVCLIHLERNIADRLRQRDRAESQRLFGRLRQAQGKAAGEEAFDDLREFVAPGAQRRCCFGAGRAPGRSADPASTGSARHAQRHIAQHQRHRKRHPQLARSHRRCQTLGRARRHDRTLGGIRTAVGRKRLPTHPSRRGSAATPEGPDALANGADLRCGLYAPFRVLRSNRLRLRNTPFARNFNQPHKPDPCHRLVSTISGTCPQQHCFPLSRAVRIALQLSTIARWGA